MVRAIQLLSRRILRRELGCLEERERVEFDAEHESSIFNERDLALTAF